MSVLPIVAPLVLLAFFVLYMSRRTSPVSGTPRFERKTSWRERQVAEHPWAVAASVGLFWGLLTGARFLLTVRPPDPYRVLGTFAVAGIVGFGPLVVFLARRASQPA